MFSKVKVALFGGKLNGFHVISLTDHLEDSIKGEDEGKTLKSKITKFSFSKNPDLLMELPRVSELRIMRWRSRGGGRIILIMQILQTSAIFSNTTPLENQNYLKS